jgi:hypothetical protein
MTETSIFPVSSDNAAPPGDHHDSEDGSPAGANRRKLFIVGGVAGVVVLAVAAFMLLHGGSSSATPAAAVVPHGHVKPAVSAPPKAGGHAAGKTVKLPKKSKVQAGRNPFTPLITAPVTGGSAAGSTTTVTAPSAGPTAPVSGSTPTPTPTPTQTTPTSGPLGTPVYLQLLSSKGTRSADFRIGYHHHKFKQVDVQAPAAGASSATVFGNDFALLSVKGGVATVQIGDGAPFELTVGVARQI